MARNEALAAPVYLEVPCTSCLRQVDQLAWHEEVVPVSAGGFVLGVRVNAPEVGVLLRELFAERVVPGALPDRNYSLWLSPRADDGVAEIHRLYRTFVRAMRSRSVRRTLDTLWHELDVRDVRAAGVETLFDVTVLVRDAQAHLLPGPLRRAIVDDLRRWERAGFRLVERSWVVLDIAAGEVVVPAPRWPLSAPEISERIAALDVDDRDAGCAVSGRFPIATWTTDGGEHTTAARVGQAGMQVLDREQRLSPELLVGLSTLLPTVGDLAPAWDGLDALRCALHALART